MKMEQVSANCYAVLNDKNLVGDANSGLMDRKSLLGPFGKGVVDRRLPPPADGSG